MNQSEHTSGGDAPEEVLALHPIAFQLVEVLTCGQGHEEFTLDPDLLPELHEGILEYDGDELLHVAHSLSGFIAAMREQHNSPTLADHVMAVLESPEIAAKLQAVTRAVSLETVEQRARSFGALLGKSGPVAPRHDDPKPEGSIRVEQLNFPKRL
jgi:hypothetical protein